VQEAFDMPALAVRLAAVFAVQEFGLPVEMPPAVILDLLGAFVESLQEAEVPADILAALLKQLARDGDASFVARMHAIAKDAKSARVRRDVEATVAKIHQRLEADGIQIGQLALADEDSARGAVSIPAAAAAGAISIARKS
jgi:hypothetical protein